MKLLSFFLVVATLVLSACGGEPFGAEALVGTGPTPGEAGQAETAAAGAPDGAAGAASAPSAAGAGGEADGSAGAAGATEASGGSGGLSSAGGAPGGGAGGTVAAPPPEPPCSPATNVSSKAQLALGTIAWCLKTTDDLNHVACTSWDNREIRVNDRVVHCGSKFTAGERANDGYNYIEIAPGKDAMASIDWSVI